MRLAAKYLIEISNIKILKFKLSFVIIRVLTVLIKTTKFIIEPRVDSTMSMKKE